MRSFKSLSFFTDHPALLIAVIALSGSFYEAFASSGVDSSYFAQRQELRGDQKLIKVEGILTCDHGTSNSSAPCALTVRENGTGIIYEVEPSKQAMELLRGGGTRKVAIQGRLDGEIITGGDVQAL